MNECETLSRTRLNAFNERYACMRTMNYEEPKWNLATRSIHSNTFGYCYYLRKNDGEK